MKSSERTKSQVVIYTDGACDPNPGPGGWAAILRQGRHEKLISGGAPQATTDAYITWSITEADVSSGAQTGAQTDIGTEIEALATRARTRCVCSR